MQVWSAKAKTWTRIVSGWRNQISPSKRKMNTSLRYTDGNSLISLDSQFSSVTQLFPTICDPMAAAHQASLSITSSWSLLKIHADWNCGAIQPSHTLSSHSAPTFSLSQHQGLFKWVSSSHQEAKVLKFQLQQQPIQWIFKNDFL